MAEKSPPTLEHQEPPIYYCWTYWTSDGEVREGCTTIKPPDHPSWPDLNDWGWVYITVPIAIVLVLVFLIYLVCSRSGDSKSKTIQKKSLLLEDSDDSDVEMEPAPRSKWSRVRSYDPDRRPKTESFYDVVQMARPDNNAAPNRKVAPRGGVTAPMQAGLYPKLSTVRRQQSGNRADQEVSVNGRPMYAKSPAKNPTSVPTNQYVNRPTMTAQKNRPKKPPQKVIELSSSESEEDDVTENEEQSEDENIKEA